MASSHKSKQQGSNKGKGGGEKAWQEYDEHLTRAEDRLEASAQKAEASFKEHTAGAEAKLEETEDKLETAARKAEKH